MKKTWIIVFTAVFLLSFNKTYAGVIFQDDFESYSPTWQCQQGGVNCGLTKWDCGYGWCNMLGSGANGGNIDGFGAEWKMGAGHNSTNAVYAWKKKGVPNGYRGSAQKTLASSPWTFGHSYAQYNIITNGGNMYSCKVAHTSGASTEPGVGTSWTTYWFVWPTRGEFYHRWYMKIPTKANWNKTVGAGFKYPRYGFTSGMGQIYLDTYERAGGGGDFSTGRLVLISAGGMTYDQGTLCNMTEVQDNQWHCYEFHVILNTPGNSNGTLEFWLDGVKKVSRTNIPWGATSVNAKLNYFWIGLGNVSDSDWVQTNWSAIGFDDVVYATEYITSSGSDGETPDNIAPAQPSGIQVEIIP
jgi:hypothetical protein